MPDHDILLVQFRREVRRRDAVNRKVNQAHEFFARQIQFPARNRANSS